MTSIVEDGEEYDESELDRYGFRSGEQYTEPKEISQTALITLRRRETKWLDVLSNWDQWMTQQPHRLRTRCRKGIPPSLRSRVWQHLSGSYQLLKKNPGEYKKLLESQTSRDLTDQIRRDLHRQFPNHLLFSTLGGTGQQALFNVLKAYCVMHPEIGYCQAHAPLASAMLIHMPEEEAFWTFVTICEEYMKDYFKQDLIRVKVELNVLMALLGRYRPEIQKHLIEHSIEPIHFAIDWLMCLFTRNLPWATVSRILDMFFFEGVKVIFRTALAVLDLLLGSYDARNRLNSMDSLLSALRKLPTSITSEDILIPQSLRHNHVDTHTLAAEYVRQFNRLNEMESR